MTYCVAARVDEGLVFLADTRVTAGFDQVNTFRKLHVFERAGDRAMVLLVAGISGFAKLFSTFWPRSQRTTQIPSGPFQECSM